MDEYFLNIIILGWYSPVLSKMTTRANQIVRKNRQDDWTVCQALKELRPQFGKRKKRRADNTHDVSENGYVAANEENVEDMDEFM